MSFSPVVTGTRLAKDEIVGPEDLPIGTIPDAVHGARLKVNEHRPGNILAARCFIEVHVDPLQLQVGVSLVGAGGVNAVLISDDLPKLGPDLVAALAGLEMYDFPHAVLFFNFYLALGSVLPRWSLEFNFSLFFFFSSTFVQQSLASLCLCAAHFAAIFSETFWISLQCAAIQHFLL